MSKSKEIVAFVPSKEVPSNIIPLSSEVAKGVTDEDFEGYGDSVANLPIVKVRHKPVTNDDGDIVCNAGGFMFYHKSMPNVKDVSGKVGLRVTILLHRLSRVMWVKPFVSGGKALCRSIDNIKGRGAPGGYCVKCPNMQWVERDDGGTDRPLCDEHINVLCYDHNSDMVYVLDVSGSGITPFNTYLSDLKFSRIPAHYTITNIGTEFMKDKGTYHKLTLTQIENLETEGIEKMNKLRSELSTSFSQVIKGDEEAPEDKTVIDAEYSELPDGVEPVSYSENDSPI